MLKNTKMSLSTFYSSYSAEIQLPGIGSVTVKLYVNYQPKFIVKNSASRRL